MWYRTKFDLNVLFIHLRTRKMPFYATVCTLRSRVDLIWTRYIRPVKARSVQFRPFLQNLHRDITVRTQCDKDGA